MSQSHTFDATGYHGAGPSAASAHADGISMWNVIHGIWARKLLFVAVFGFTMLAVVYYLATVKASYTPQTRLLVENTENAFTRPQSSSNQRVTVDQNEVVSQVQVLLSSDLARKVIKDLDLARYADFRSAAAEDSSGLSNLFGLIGQSTPPSRETVEQRLLDRYFKRLSVYPVTQSRVIVIEFTASDPAVAAKVANTIAATYVQATREVKYSAAKSAMTWLAGEIGRLRQTVAISEAAVEEFRARKGLFRTDRTTLNAQELAGVNSQIILASAARSEAQARARSIRDLLKKHGGIGSSSDVLRSTVIQRLREQQVTLQRTYADLQTTYLPSHPRMQRLQAEIDDFSRQIRSEALKVVKGLENEARVQGAREASLRASLSTLKAKASTSNQDEITLRAMEREAEANRSLLQTFLQRFTEASARQDIASLPAGARIISRAQTLGKPTFPKIKPLFMMGLGGAFLLALLVVFAAEVLSAKEPGAPVQTLMRRKPVFEAPTAPVAPQ
ncbi:MAG: GumC family protein, partial [Hyphomicrobiales bacterium]